MLGLRLFFSSRASESPFSRLLFFFLKKPSLKKKKILICNNFVIMGTNKSIPEQTEDPPDVSQVPEVFDG